MSTEVRLIAEETGLAEIRIIGVEADCQDTIAQLATVFDVHKVRGPYPSRRKRPDNDDGSGKPVLYYADVKRRRRQTEPGA